jgi:hypothetical protein
VLPPGEMRDFCLNLNTMAPSWVGAPSRTGQSTRSSTQGPQGGTSEMSIVVDVDEIQTLKYEKTTLHVEEEIIHT